MAVIVNIVPSSRGGPRRVEITDTEISGAGFEMSWDQVELLAHQLTSMIRDVNEPTVRIDPAGRPPERIAALLKAARTALAEALRHVDHNDGQAALRPAADALRQLAELVAPSREA